MDPARLGSSWVLALGACAAAGGEAAEGPPALVVAPQDPAAAPEAGFRGPGPLFRTRRLRAVAGRPEHLLAGDLDLDGDQDLLATCEGEGPLFLWRGGPGGLAAEPEELVAGGWPLAPVALAGPLDAGGESGVASGRVALASRAERTLSVLDLSAGGAATVVWRAEGIEDTPRALAAGDLDRDGHTDVAIATERELWILGGGRTQRVPLAGRIPRCACVLADGSGVVIGFQDTRTLEVVGRAGTVETIELGFIPRDLLELEFDYEPGPELAVVGGESSLWIFGVEGSIYEPPPDPLVLVTSATPLALTSGDFASGRGEANPSPDLFVLSAYGLRAEVYGFACSSQTLTGDCEASRRASYYAGQTPRGIATGDFDADGQLDFAVANQGARSIGIFFGSRDVVGFDAPVDIAVGVTPNALIVQDILHDSLPDVAVLCAKDLELQVLVNHNGELQRAHALPTGAEPRALAVVDWQTEFRRDPRPELAFVDQDGDRARIRVVAVGKDGLEQLAEFHAGRGAADMLGLGPGTGTQPLLAVADDVEGALVVLDPAGEVSRSFIADGVPRALCALELVDGEPHGIAVALGAPGVRRGVSFVDHTADFTGKQILFEDESSFMPTQGSPIDLVALPRGAVGPPGSTPALVVLSLVDPRRTEGYLELLAQDGPGTPYRLCAVAPTGSRPQHVAAADVDGDGVVEVFVAEQNEHRVAAWRVLAGPEPAFEPLDGLGAHLGCLDVALADVDGDGLLDVLAANGFSDDVSAILARPGRQPAGNPR